ncbi:MAG: NAD(P)/FAD-dependent oxidoreductase [Planctomycetota bacterium]
MKKQPSSKAAGKDDAISHDVLIVGAGPAGSTAATLLAQHGHKVLVLEKDEFPRFHIGESLLPMCLPVLDRMGVMPDTDIFVFKQGAEFVCEKTGRQRRFVFTETLPGCGKHAWHVDRSRFDTALRDAAVRAGAEVRHGVTVTDCGTTADHAWVKTRDGTLRARYLIDASGQSRLMARRADAAIPYDQFGRCAVFTHYEGVGNAAWAELGPGKEIRVVLTPAGWGWIIPLPDRRLSIGLVSNGKITDKELQAQLLGGPLVTRLIAGAKRLETRVIGNYSYRNRIPSGPRFGANGDAACFLDPVFSSGVTLALRGGEGLADAVSKALKAGTEDDAKLLAEHEKSMNRAFRTFAGLIDRFYNSHFAQTIFLGPPSDDLQMRRGIMSVLAGDVWREGNVFQDMLLSARRQEKKKRLAAASRGPDAGDD